MVTLVDDLFIQLTSRDGNAVIANEDLFANPIRDFSFTDAPASKVRSVFTWARPIGNMYEYFRNMTRLKFNRVYLWNEFLPVNTAEVVEYAHSWGIEVFWGFAWDKVAVRASGTVKQDLSVSAE